MEFSWICDQHQNDIKVRKITFLKISAGFKEEIGEYEAEKLGKAGLRS